MTAPSDGGFPDVSSRVPAPARMYDYCLGGKNNYQVDRAAVLTAMRTFPWALNDTRHNRLFLYRAVRFLARDAGIRQFLDLGSGLPTENNVHQVAQRFRPDAQVVYVDNDPTVLTYGRALLTTDGRTTVIDADMTRPEEILDDPRTHQLLDLTQPVAVLFLSIGHLITDDATLDRMVTTFREAAVSGSYLALTQFCLPDQASIDESEKLNEKLQLDWRNRLPESVVQLLRGMDPVDPGLVYVRDWRPDPGQPPLPPVDEPLRPFLDVHADPTKGGQFGGVLRKP